MAIIAILAAMLMPALQQARERAQFVTCQNNYKQIGNAYAFYLDSNEDFLPGPTFNRVEIIDYGNQANNYAYNNTFYALDRLFIKSCLFDQGGSAKTGAAALTSVLKVKNTPWLCPKNSNALLKFDRLYIARVNNRNDGATDVRRVLNGLHGYAGQSLPKKITNCITPINGKTGSYSKVALYYENHIGEDTVYGTDCHNGSFNVLYADLHVGSVKLGSMNYNQLTAPQYY